MADHTWLTMAGKTRSKSASVEKNASDEIEGQNISLSVFKDLLKVQESTIQCFFRSFVDAVNDRIDNIVKEVSDLKHRIEYTQGQVNDLLEVNCNKKIKEIQDEIEKLLEKTDDLENRSRRNNLCFDGISETSSGIESWDLSETKIKTILVQEWNKTHFGIILPPIVQ